MDSRANLVHNILSQLEKSLVELVAALSIPPVDDMTRGVNVGCSLMCTHSIQCIGTSSLAHGIYTLFEERLVDFIGCYIGLNTFISNTAFHLFLLKDICHTIEP